MNGLPFDKALGLEQELLELKLVDTVLRAGFQPYEHPGSDLLYRLGAEFVAEEVAGDARPVAHVWAIASELGMTPEWVPTDLGENL